jgi:hypothetical protein
LAREAAQRSREALLRKAEDWRNSDEGREALSAGPMRQAVVDVALSMGLTAQEIGLAEQIDDARSRE